MAILLILVGVLLLGRSTIQAAMDDAQMTIAVQIGEQNGIPVGRIERVFPIARRVARERDIDLALLLAVVHQESRFDPVAENPNDPSYGLGQVQPFWIDGRIGIVGTAADLLNPEFNLRTVAEILRYFEGRNHVSQPYRVFQFASEIDVYQRGETQFRQGNRNFPYRDSVTGFFQSWQKVRS